MAEDSIFSQNLVTFDPEIWPFTPIALLEYVAIYFYPTYQITLPLDIPSWSHGWKWHI